METSEKHDDLLEEAKERFDDALAYYSDEYQRGQDDIRFAMLGEQWPEEIKAERQLGSRPCLTENRVHTSILQVVNSIRQSRPAIQVNPIDSGSDIETARIIKGIVRNIETNSGADNVYDTAALNAVASGYGWIRIETDYADNEGFDQEVKIKRVPDFTSVMLDPNSKELDGSDAEYGFAYTSIEHEEFERLYPDAQEIDFKSNGKDGWANEKTCRLVEYFYKEYETRTIVMTADGAVMDKKDAGDTPTVGEREIRIPSVKWCLLSANEVLDKRDVIGQFIPLVPVYGEEVFDQGRSRFYSLVTHAKDPQRRYNYWLTASTELIALQPRTPFVGAAGQFKSSAGKWQTANTASHAYLEYDVVKTPSGQEITTPPQRQMPPTGSPAMFQEMMAAADGVKATLGIFDASLGANGNEKSGKAILARQTQSDNSTFHFVDNLQTSIRHVGRILVDLIPKIYHGARVVRIIGEDGSKSLVPLAQPVIKAKGGNYQPAPVGQPQEAYFDLGVGKYDVVATVGQSYISQRRETAEMMQGLIQAIPEAANILGDIFIKNLDIPEADLIIERMKRVNPLLNDEKDPAAQKLEQAGQALQAMQQQMAQMEAALQAKREKDTAETQAEIAKTSVEIEKIRADIQKTEVETAKMVAEVQAARVQSVGITPDQIAEVIQTVARLEAEIQDTADAVDILISDEEQKRATLPPEPQEQMQTETL